MEDLSPFRSDFSRSSFGASASSTGEEATSWPGGPSWLSAEGGAVSCFCVCPYSRYQMKVWMTRRRGILGRKPTLFPNPRTSSADMGHNGELLFIFTVSTPTSPPSCQTVPGTGLKSSSCWPPLLFLSALLLTFSADVFPDSCSLALSSACCRLRGRRGRSNDQRQAGERDQTRSRCSPRSCVRTGDLEADLLNGSVHDFIVGLNGRMNHQLNLHSSNINQSLVSLCVCRVPAFPSFCQAPSWRCRPG